MKEQQDKISKERYPSLRPKSKKELAAEYGLSRDTIRSYCKEIGIYTNKHLSIPELKRFYKHYDIPIIEYRGDF